MNCCLNCQYAEPKKGVSGIRIDHTLIVDEGEKCITCHCPSSINKSIDISKGTCSAFKGIEEIPLRDGIFRGLNPEDVWLYGYLRAYDQTDKLDTHCELYVKDFVYGKIVKPETIGQFTALLDVTKKPKFEGDVVYLFGFYGKVIRQHGAFGIYFPNGIDYGDLASKIVPVTGIDTAPMFCRNDNFVSFWELMWNYDQTENICEVVTIVGDVHRNSELIGGNKNG